MLTELEIAERRVKLYESDLKDTQDPRVLARWPNLGQLETVEHAQKRLAEARLELIRLRGY